jgi:hypothetical protein
MSPVVIEELPAAPFKVCGTCEVLKIAGIGKREVQNEESYDTLGKSAYVA